MRGKPTTSSQCCAAAFRATATRSNARTRTNAAETESTYESEFVLARMTPSGMVVHEETPLLPVVDRSAISELGSENEVEGDPQ